MAMTQKVVRVVGNPASRAKKSGRKNPGAEILGFTLAGNPGNRKGGMGATKSKKKGGHKSGGSAKSKYKSNPASSHHASGKTHKKKYRHNPGGMTAGLGASVTNAIFVIVGAVGSKLGAQVALGSNNTGLMGYAGNLAAGGLLWLLFDKGLKNRNAANGILAGTLVQVILRAINDYTPFGQYVAQLGMGDYQMQSFVTPQVLVNPWHNADVSIPAGWGGGQMALPAPAAVTPAPGGGSGGGPAGAAAASAAGRGMSGGLYGGGWGGGLYG